MDETPSSSSQSTEVVYPRAHRLMRGLTWVYGSAVLALWLWLIFGFMPDRVAPGMAREWLIGGFGAIALSALLVALTASVATLALTGTRFRYAAALESQRTDSIEANPGVAARQGQALIVTMGALCLWVVDWLFWPSQAAQTVDVAANVGTASFVAAFALGFMSLVAERLVSAFPEPQLPEAPTLRRLLLFSTVTLVAGACLEMGRTMGLTWLHWPVVALAVLPCAVMLELTVRALARLFLPPPLPANATAVTDSLLAAVFTGGPRSPSVLLRTHLGLDFSRSWAVAFLSAAFLPAVFGTGLVCWGLSGVKLIDLGQRGVYERFGAPVAVLGPGLHVLLPWPLGRLRPVEYGQIDSVVVGVDQADAAESMAADAEAPAPLTLNRLWETSHPGQAYYLVPTAGSGPQGFQEIATEIHVLYRVGLSDSAALQSVYAVAEPEALVKYEADRLVLRFFNSRTLEAVIGARRENVAGALRDQLAAEIDSRHAGIEIVSVLIEEIHPPNGAATAYHAVQAAEINATASIFDEQAKAKQTAGNALQEAYQMTTAADAKGGEIRHAAQAVTYGFNADRRAFAAGGKAFLVERFYRNLNAALSKIPITIMDHRLDSADGPVLDLRAPAASVGASKPAAPAPLIPGIERP